MPLLPRFHRRQLEREDTRRVDRVVAEAADHEPDLLAGNHGGDRHALRGIPVIAAGVPGSRRDEHPERAYLQKERRARRHGR